MLYLKKVLYFTLAFLLISSFSFYFFVLSKPTLGQPQIVDAQSVQAATTVLKRLNTQWRLKNKNIQLTLRQHEIAALATLANNVDSRIHVNARLETDTVSFEGMIALPLPIERRFVKFRATLMQSIGVAKLKDISVGQLPISESLFWSAVNYGLTKFVLPDLEKPAQAFVLRVNSNQNMLSALIELPDSFLKNTGQSGLVAKLSQASLSEQIITRANYYVSWLAQYSKNHPNENSFEAYIQSVFREAKNQNQNINEELSGAIVALTWFFGDNRFDRYITGFLTLTKEQIEVSKEARTRVTLLNRQDLRKHFLYSAYIQLIGSNSVSYFVGELKELSDAISGTGFSFADLQADRAGTLFSHLATHSKESGELLVLRGLENSGLVLIPSIERLPEGLNQAKFERIYQHTASPEYVALVAEIDNRIWSLPLYSSPR